MRSLVTLFTIIAVLALASCGGEPNSQERTLVPSAHATARGPEARDQPLVASKWSRKYHNRDCQWARKISPKNLVGYESREDAARDGRQPCGACRP